MPTVQTVLDALERLAPTATAFEWDRIGLQVGDPSAPIESAAVALDPSIGLIEFARTKGARLLVCHHPAIWDPVKAVTETNRPGRLVSEMIRQGMSFIAAHTNWDAAPAGINGRLAEILGLLEVECFGIGSEVAYSKLVFFAPAATSAALINALAQAGAGTIGLYERCAFWNEGTGTFIGAEGSRPAIGQADRQEEVGERRIEMRVPTARLREAVNALKSVHPYEEPAFDVYPLHPQNERPLGRIGRLDAPQKLAQFQLAIDQTLQTRCWTFGDASQTIARVAVCGGAADDEWRAARAAGADVFVTGEVKHHNAVEAAESGFAIVAAGHFATEHPGCDALRAALAEAVPSVAWHLYAPPIGQSGRPLP